MRSRHILFFVLIAFFAFVTHADGQASEKVFEGKWYAILKAPAGEVPFELKIHKQGDKYSGVLEDGNYKAELQDFKFEGGRLFFGIDDARIRFEVEQHGDQLTGTWTRKGTSTSQLSFVAGHIQN